MKFKTLPFLLSAVLFSATSSLVSAADEPTKSTADQGTSMRQPDKAISNQGAQVNQADNPAKDSSAQMKALDADGDAAVSKTEAAKMKGMSDSFDAADANKDGKLDANEFKTGVSQIKK